LIVASDCGRRAARTDLIVGGRSVVALDASAA